jgi:glutaminyl-tRNA synthetase
MAEPAPVESKQIEPNAPNFLHELVDQEIATGTHRGQVITRFPPEPNGFLHIGHAKSICLNYGIAERYGGICNLRFDDTNPLAEETEYVEAIQEDVGWMGFETRGRTFFASDYFEQLYEFAVKLIEKDKAYVDSQSLEQIRQSRGNYYGAGSASPFRERGVSENLELFQRMRAGEFPEGAHVLRAKIDMVAPNLNLRDPVLYRIRHAAHHRTGDKWCIYPTYDFAHGQSDAIEGVTHSICTLEFEDHRPLYDWLVIEIGFDPRPRQFEFARLNLTYTVLSKRVLQKLVRERRVSGWDDPRMPTLAGLRRRGYTPEAIRRFCERIGVSKRDNLVDVSLLEHELREDLNLRSQRVMAVLRPLKVVIENFPEGQLEEFEALNHPEYPDQGSRRLPFSRELYIEQEDFREEPPKGWFRLAPGREVRLRYACLITCKDVVKDDAGNVVELRCTWDPSSRGGSPADGRKVRGTLHWVSAAHAADAEVRLYDRLFSSEQPLGGEDEGDDFMRLNPNSLEIVQGCKVEPSLASPQPMSRYQFERLGYFTLDPDARPGQPVFNRTITLRDTWAKIESKLKARS